MRRAGPISIMGCDADKSPSLLPVALVQPGSQPRPYVPRPSVPITAPANVAAPDGNASRFQTLIDVLTASSYPKPLRAVVCADLLKIDRGVFKQAGVDSCTCPLLTSASSAQRLTPNIACHDQGETTSELPSRQGSFTSAKARSSDQSGSRSPQAATPSPNPRTRLLLLSASSTLDPPKRVDWSKSYSAPLPTPLLCDRGSTTSCSRRSRRLSHPPGSTPGVTSPKQPPRRVSSSSA